MKRPKIVWLLLYTLLLATVVVIIVNSKKTEVGIPTRNDTIEDVEALGGWWVFVPAEENDKLEGDVFSTFFDEDYSVVNLVLPKDIDEKKVVFYVRDAADRYAMKCIGDFSEGDLQLGSKTLRLIKSELPFVFLSTDRSELEELNADETKIQIPYVEGDIVCDNGISSSVKISPRGNATWTYPKKPYSLEFENKHHLLGMTSHKKWNMLANYIDTTLLSNEVFYEFADRIGLPYTCERELATVYINGEYKGVYQFTTKHSVGKHTINLKYGDYLLLLADPEIENDADTIPYFSIDSSFIKNDNNDGSKEYASSLFIPRWVSSSFSIQYPKDDTNIDFISNFTQKAFRALEDGESDEYLEYFDLDNMVKFYYLQELSHNGDATGKSIYLYYDSSKEKLIFGPVWDMDNTIFYENINPYDLVANRSWYRSFFIHDSFVNRLKELYENDLKAESSDILDYFEAGAEKYSIDGELNLKLIKKGYNDYLNPIVPISYSDSCTSKASEFLWRINYLDELIMEDKIRDNIQFP